MTDQTTPPATQDPLRPRRGRLRRFLFIFFIVLAAGITGGVASQALSHGSGFGPGFWHGRGFASGPFDPAWAEDRADRMVRHLAVEIDATGEQEQKLRTVVNGLIRDLLPMRERAQLARRDARLLLMQATVDRAAIEKLRAEQLALVDAFSKRVAQALGDAAEVLTPEQRRLMGDYFGPSGYWRGRGRG